MTTPLAVQPGSYNVTETVPSGWTLDTADCEKNGSGVGDDVVVLDTFAAAGYCDGAGVVDSAGVEVADANAAGI